jgi:hypothetical protein
MVSLPYPSFIFDGFTWDPIKQNLRSNRVKDAFNPSYLGIREALVSEHIQNDRVFNHVKSLLKI